MATIGRHKGYIPNNTTCAANTIYCSKVGALAAWEGQSFEQVSRDVYQAYGKMPILDKEHEQLVRRIVRLVSPALMQLANTPLRGVQFDQAFAGRMFQEIPTFAALHVSRYGETGYSLYFEPPCQEEISYPECEIIDLKDAQEVVDIAQALLLELGNEQV